MGIKTKQKLDLVILIGALAVLGLLIFWGSGGSLKFDFRNGAEAEWMGKKRIWKEIFEDTDIVCERTDEGVKETIIFKSEEAVRRLGFRFNISEGIVFEKDDSNNIIFRDAESAGADEYLYRIPAPVMWDAAGKATADVEVKILKNTEDPSELLVGFRPSEEWLSSPERVFPIYLELEPSIVRSSEADFDEGIFEFLQPVR